MIFKNKAAFQYVILCFILLLISIIGCNKNPIGNNFEDEEKTNYGNEQTWSVYAIGQHSDGNMFAIDYQGIYLLLDNCKREEITSFKKNPSGLHQCSDCFVKDRNGSLVFSIDTNLIRIVTDGLKYSLDTIGHISYYDTKFESRFAIDDDKNIWFTDQCDSGITLLKWDGEKLETYPLHIQDTLKPSFDVNRTWIAAGGDNVYIAYMNTRYLNSSGSTSESNVEKKIIIMQWNSFDNRITTSEKFWSEIKPLNQMFFIMNKLFITYYNYSQWNSGMYLVPFFDEEYNDIKFITNIHTPLRLLKQNATTAYMYSDTSIIKISESITRKDLYSNYNCLFLDTSGAVIMYDQTHENYVNVSNLPGFRNSGN